MKITMKLLILLCLTAIAPALIGQEAKVVVLSGPDAELAHKVYERMKQANAEWDKLREVIAHGYFSDVEEVEEMGTLWTTAERELAVVKAKRESEERRAKATKKKVYHAKSGWENGFEFSSDFKFIVPAQPPKVETCAPRYPWGIATTTPAIVTQ